MGEVVSSLLVDSSIDPRKVFTNIVGMAKGVRVGCLGITILVGLLGGGLVLWIDKLPLTILVALLFAACLVGTIWF